MIIQYQLLFCYLLRAAMDTCQFHTVRSFGSFRDLPAIKPSHPVSLAPHGLLDAGHQGQANLHFLTRSIIDFVLELGLQRHHSSIRRYSSVPQHGPQLEEGTVNMSHGQHGIHPVSIYLHPL
jgi:hypothetical protein